jgi:hypothetical protein
MSDGSLRRSEPNSPPPESDHLVAERRETAPAAFVIALTNADRNRAERLAVRVAPLMVP